MLNFIIITGLCAAVLFLLFRIIQTGREMGKIEKELETYKELEKQKQKAKEKDNLSDDDLKACLEKMKGK